MSSWEATGHTKHLKDKKKSLEPPKENLWTSTEVNVVRATKVAMNMFSDTLEDVEAADTRKVAEDTTNESKMKGVAEASAGSAKDGASSTWEVVSCVYTMESVPEEEAKKSLRDTLA